MGEPAGETRRGNPFPTRDIVGEPAGETPSQRGLLSRLSRAIVGEPAPNAGYCQGYCQDYRWLLSRLIIYLYYRYGDLKRH